jgi:hypothetical protein
MLVVGDERTAVAEALRVAQPGDAVLVMRHEDRYRDNEAGAGDGAK